MRSGEMKMRFLLAVLSLVLLLGCGATTATPEDNPTDGDSSADGDGSDGLKIYDIRNTESANHPAVGTSVTVNNVVVISNVFNAASNLKGVFLSDIGGGEYSAVLMTWKPTSADASYGYDPPALSAGMVINVVGNYNEFCGTKAPYYTHCSQQIELTPYQKDKGSVVDTGSTAALPIAKIVDPAAVKTDGTDSAKWQNALIAVDNVAVTGAADSYKVFTITGDLKVDDTIYKYGAPEVGTEFDRIMGFLYTSYDAVALLPRGAGDMVPKGQLDGDLDDINIPDGDGEENAETEDGDTAEYESPEAEDYEVDFDHEGLMIVDLQNAASPKHPEYGTSVTLNGVVAISDVFTAANNLKGVMISDIGGGPWAAILLTWKPTSASAQYGYDPPVFTKGQVINVVGNFNAFCGTSTTNPYKHCSIQVELTPYQKDKGSVTVTEDTAEVPAPRVVNPALIRTDGAESAIWQSSLVEVDNVFVETAPNGYGIFTVDAGLEIDDQLFAYDKTQITVGKNYEKIVGYLFTSYDTVHIVPRSAEDMVVGTQVLDGDTTDNETTPVDGDSTDNDTTPVDGDTADNDTTDNDTTPTDGDSADNDIPIGNEYTIAQLANKADAKHPAANTRVVVKGAVIASDIFSASGTTLKAVFIADPAGGPYHGLVVTWRPTGTANYPAYTPPAFSVGTVVDVEGNYNEFCGVGTPPPYTRCTYQIELSPYGTPNPPSAGSITTKAQGGSVPAAQVVLPASIKTDGVDVLKWQNALVEVDNVSVLTVPNQYDIFTVTDGLEIDDQFYNYDNATITVGKSFTKIVGFLYVSYNTAHVIPRSIDDLVSGAAVDGDTTDNDTVDNDTVIVDGDVTDTDTTDNDTTDNDTTDNDTTDNDTTDNDTTDSDTTPAVTEATILQLNDKSNAGHPAIGTRVLIKNAVVTSVVFDSASNIKGAFISEQVSGAYRGILVTWRPTATANNPAYTPPALTVGSIVDVEGNYNEFCGIGTPPPYTHCTTQIELSPYGTPMPSAGSITVTGNGGTVPLAQVVLPAAIKTDGADVAKWQGSLVEVDNVTVLTAPTSSTFGIFTVTDGLEIDDQFYKYTYAGITVDKSYSKIVGFLFISYNTVHIIPRSIDDLVDAPVVVDGDTDNDTTDTDGTTEPPVPTVATIYQIQNPLDAMHPATSSLVQTNSVVVTSAVWDLSSSLKAVLVSEQAGGENSSLMLVWKPATYTTAPTLAVGDVVTVTGTYVEFGSTEPMAELDLTPTNGTVGSIVKNSQSVTPPAAQVVLPSEINSTGAKRDAWQGSLVEVDNVKVTVALDSYNSFTVTDNLYVDDRFFANYGGATISVDAVYSKIVGFLYVTSNKYFVLPRNASDMVLAPVVEDGDADTTDTDTTDTDTTDNDTTDTDTTDNDTTPAAHLVINEIDYDMVGTSDSMEYVEIYNPSSSAVSLTGLSVFMVNGSNSTSYGEVKLSGSLPAGGYALIHGSTYSPIPDACALLHFATSGATDQIQNGNPDGVVLFDTVNKVVVDSVSYEGTVAPSALNGTDGSGATVAYGTYTILEGTALPLTTLADSNTIDGSLSRNPNGSDTNDYSVDFKFVQKTPCAANSTVTPTAK